MAHVTESQMAGRVRDYIEAFYARGTMLGEDGRSYEVPSTGMPREVGEFIVDMVRSERPHATLETGLAWGRSTLFILRALLENGDEFRPHVAMDPFQATSFHSAARRSLRELGVADLVEFYEERSEFVLPRLLQERRQFDLAYIDANHLFDFVFVEFRFIHTLLKPGGLMIFDDTDWDGVHLTCRFAETNLGYRRVAQVGRSAGVPLDHKPNPLDPPLRPRMTAYRKPMQELERQEAQLAPCFDGFPQLARTGARNLRHKGLAALAAGDRSLARRLFILSLAHEPGHPKTYLRLLRTFIPLNVARMLSAKTRRTVSQRGSTIQEVAGDRSTP